MSSTHSEAELIAGIFPLAASGIVHSVFDRVLNVQVCTEVPVGYAAPFLLAVGLPGTGAQLTVDSLPRCVPGEGVTWNRDVLRIGANWLPVRREAASFSHVTTQVLSRKIFGTWRLKALRTCAVNSVSLADRLAACVLEEQDFTEVVRAVVGNGPGLTPSGDDVLVGVLLRLSVEGRSLEFANLGGAVRDHLNHTNHISAHLLQLAATGWFSSPLIGLITDPESPTALRRVLAVGATSGSDAVIGLCLPLNPPQTALSPDFAYSEQGVSV